MPPKDDKPRKDGSPPPGQGLRGILRRGQVFIEEILRENESLRLRTVQLESKLHEKEAAIPVPVAAADELRELFERLHREHDDLQRRLDEIAAETEQYKSRYQQIEEENDRLVNLFVANHQLHSTLDLPGVVQIVVEILLNFVGAGRFALLLREPADSSYHAVEAYGLELPEIPVLSGDSEPLRSVMESGEPHVDDEVQAPFDVQKPRVCIPLFVGGQPFGAVVVWAYLKQKQEISDVDWEIFKLLGDHAGVAMESARLHAGAGETPGGIDAYRTLLRSEGSHE